MPMSGVINEILEREGGSMRDKDDFFSVASTIPFVADDRKGREVSLDRSWARKPALDDGRSHL